MPTPREEAIARVKARRVAGPSSSPDVSAPTESTREALGGDLTRNLLIGGTLVGMIPHPATKMIGAASGLGLAGFSGMDALKAALNKQYGEAAVDALFAVLGASGLRGLRATGGAKAAVEEAAPSADRVREVIAAARKQAGAKRPTSPSEARRILREQRLAARALTRAGKEVPKELEQAILRSAKAAEKMAGTAEQAVATSARRSAKTSQKVKETAFAKHTTLSPSQQQAIKDLEAVQEVSGGAGARGVGAGTYQESVGKVIQRAKKASAKAAVAKGSRPPEVDRAEAAVTGVLQKLGAPADTISRVRASLAKGGKVSKKQRKAYDEVGKSATEIMMRIAAVGGGAAAGGAVGAEMRPEDSERSRLMFGLAGAGAGALTGGTFAALALAPKGAKLRAAMDLNMFSLLSGPATLAKSTLGSLTATVVGAAQRMLEGRPRDAARILDVLLKESAKGTWLKAFNNPKKFMTPSMLAKTKVPVREGVMGLPTRFIAAGDALSSRALMAGGFSREEALRFNLSGDPRTPVGKWLMTALGQSVWQVGKGGRSSIVKPNKFTQSEQAQLLLRYFLPFPRVAAQIGEMGLEFSPITALSPKLQRMFGHTSQAESFAKGLLGPLAAGWGAMGATEVSPDLDPLASAMMGPLAAAGTIGQLAVRGAQSDRPVLSSVNQMMQNVNPLVGEMFSFADLPARPIPGAVRDVARAIDPAFNRETGAQSVVEMAQRMGQAPNPAREAVQTFLAKAQSRLPVLREGLPERPMPVDVFGKPLFPSRPAFIPDVTLRGFQGDRRVVVITAPKMVTSTPIQNPPVFPTRNPTAQVVREVQKRTRSMGEILSPPQAVESPALRELYGLQGDVASRLPRDVRLSALRARGAPIEMVLKDMVRTPAFAKMPPEMQNLLLRRAIASVRSQTGPPVSALANTAILNPSARGEVQKSLQSLVQGYERRLQ